MNQGHGEKRTRKKEQAIAALLSEATAQAAAAKAGVSESTLKRWRKEPGFRTAYRQARRELLESSIGRIQAATGTAVDTLLTVAQTGAKEGDRVRAAVALLDMAVRGLTEADTLHGDDSAGDQSPMDTADLVKLLAARLRQLEQSDLSSGEKARRAAPWISSLAWVERSP